MTSSATRPAARPLALVTGASSGIGREFALQLAARGHDLVLAARNAAALESLAAELRAGHGVEAVTVVTDLSLPGAGTALAAEVAGRGLTVDVLVNNAGLGLGGAFAENDPAALTGMVQLNVVALTELTRALLPGMLARGRGRVLNVASTAAFQPGPLMAAYYATKAYVLSLSEALSEEVRGSGVTVTCLCPGPTRTAFEDRAGVGGSRLFKGGMVKVMDASAVARIGLDALFRGRRVAVPGLLNRLLVGSAKTTPHFVSLPMVRYLQSDAA